MTVHVWCEIETCRREQTYLTAASAFDAGWDFAGPGGTVPLGVIAPRTCPNHGIADGTVWGALVLDKLDPSELTAHQLAVVERILARPTKLVSDGPRMGQETPPDGPEQPRIGP